VPVGDATDIDPRETARIAAARAGDGRAFEALVAPLRRELHLHCYRLLGSAHDAEDALQDTLVQAWRRLDSFGGRAPFRSWLYRIATNTSLNALRSRTRRVSAAAVIPPSTTPRAPIGMHPELPGVEPYPDALIDDTFHPHARYESRESVTLAFLVAIHRLPARQRAVLILRDVLGFSADEVAQMLETSRAAVNSALHRARTTMDAEVPDGPPREPSPHESDLIRRFVAAWDGNDATAIAELLAADAILTMPPFPAWYLGREAIARFLSTIPGEGDLRRVRLVETSANGQPALAAYAQDPTGGPFAGYGLMVFRIEGEEIAEITGFADPRLIALFELPGELAG
jgi:RNA polymerase sigma-70 factor (TIGR02960 family)